MLPNEICYSPDPNLFIGSTRTFPNVPKLKNVIFVREGPEADKILIDAALSHGLARHANKDDMIQMLDKRIGKGDITIRGTIGYPAGSSKLHAYARISPGLRRTVAHEKFHTLPIVGSSEYLAHIAGGMVAKGGLGVKLKSTGDSLKDFISARPGRAIMEPLVIAGLGYGAYRGGKALYNAIRKKKDIDPMDKQACLVKLSNDFYTRYGLAKFSGQDAEEPVQVVHDHSPNQLLRPRAEAIIFNKDGILAIMKKKQGYLLMPGGGIPSGETADGTIIRECLEEADAILKNTEKMEVSDVVYDKDNIICPGWDGERTHFYLALYGGAGKTDHPDRESFKFIPFDDAIAYLKELIADPKQAWAKHNNEHRLAIVEKAKRLAKMPAALEFKKYAACLRKYRGKKKRRSWAEIDYIRRFSQ